MTDTSFSSSGLRGLRAAVLGSTSGIGRAVALVLAKAGADVLIHGRVSTEAAETLANEVRSLGGRAHVLMADLADNQAGDRLVSEAWDVWNGLDAWLHIAGADMLTGPGAKLSFDAKLDHLWAVDVRATMRLCRAIGQRMKAQGHGSIVTMGWDQAETGMEGDSGELFTATKGAIMAFTRSLALSLAPHVRVNALAPGWIKTAWASPPPRSGRTAYFGKRPWLGGERRKTWRTSRSSWSVPRRASSPGRSSGSTAVLFEDRRRLLKHLRRSAWEKTSVPIDLAYCL